MRRSLASGEVADARKTLDEIQAGVQESYADVRELLIHFRTRAGEGDVEHGIRSLLARFERQAGVPGSLKLRGTALPLAPDDQLQVMHIVQEALSNVRKHARASHVEVEIQRGPGHVFVVRDDGRGFDASHPPVNGEEHVGLRIMRERADRIGATVSVRSGPGRGTEITLSMPIVEIATNGAQAASPLRLVVIDDHTLFRRGLIALLAREPGFAVVAEAADGFEGIKAVAAARPDVVLLDLNMPGISGVEAIGAIRKEAPDTRVVMLTVSEDAEDLLSALRAGACGYLLKNIDSEFLVSAIRRAAVGDSVVSPEMTSKLVEQVRTSGRAAPEDALSTREREILAHLARGMSNKEIARALDVAESTVKLHVQHILRKLDLASRVQAAIWAVEHGIAARG